MIRRLLISSLFVIGVMSCKKGEEIEVTLPYQTVYDLTTPSGFPTMKIPLDNPMTVEKIALGKKLFFDPILSRDKSISCASCHFSQGAFADTVALSLGVEKRIGERNAPTILNAGYKPHLFKEGGVRNLELQVIAPFDNELEFDLHVLEAIARLKADDTYKKLFNQVFGKNPDLFGLTRAIAAYERTLISGNSKYDLSKNGLVELSASEKNGEKLFFSDELQCGTCHSGTFFTDNKFYNTGLYANYIDEGLKRVTTKEEDVGKFVTPTLRNVEYTGPYMFDGSLKTLEEVIDHFASGGKNHINKSDLFTGFTITESEKQDLIAFLYTLSEKAVIELE